MVTRIVWQRLDVPGLEWAQIDRRADGSTLVGTAIVVQDQVIHRIEYSIELDASGRTRTAHVDAAAGDDAPLRIDLVADGHGRWECDGATVIDSPGCLDIDIGFSPLTNSLPIWRLGLEPGESRDIETAWLRFPGLDLIQGSQTYDRVGDRTWRYRSARFEALLEVDAEGLVTEYGRYWRAVGRGA
ncbi:MAG TPA: putative glycolipid-binding domain-containing protein [Candidatus Limnocylindrales bacterium]